MYKVGDKVRIAKDTKRLMPSRRRYLGTIMTIERVENAEYFDTTYNRLLYGECYVMKEDYGLFLWAENMIEGLAEEEKIVTTKTQLININGQYVINWS